MGHCASRMDRSHVCQRADKRKRWVLNNLPKVFKSQLSVFYLKSRVQKLVRHPPASWTLQALQWNMTGKVLWVITHPALITESFTERRSALAETPGLSFWVAQKRDVWSLTPACWVAGGGLVVRAQQLCSESCSGAWLARGEVLNPGDPAAAAANWHNSIRFN